MYVLIDTKSSMSTAYVRLTSKHVRFITRPARPGR